MESAAAARHPPKRQFAREPPPQPPVLPGGRLPLRRCPADAARARDARPSWPLRSRSPSARAQASLARTSPSPPHPAMLPGDPNRRTTPSYFVPSSQPLRSSAKKKKKSPYTHSLQSPSPPSAVEGHPTVLTGPGRDAGDRRNGDPPGGDQPGDTRGRAVGSPAPTESGCQSPKCRHLPSGSTRPRERPQGSQSERATRAPAAPAWGPRALLRRPLRGFVYIRARRKPCAGAFITGWPSVLHTREATWAARVATCARGPSGGACASLPPGRTHSTWYPTQGRRCSSRVAPAAARSPRCH